jgi:hypothetical protein
MNKFRTITEKYIFLGVRQDNIEFAIDAVKDGTRREIIIDSLTADYRGMNEEQAQHLLNELFVANGGEFKKENRGGYLYAALFLLVGIACLVILIALLYNNGYSRIGKLIALGIVALGGISGGIKLLLKAIQGKFRDEDEPFKD